MTLLLTYEWARLENGFVLMTPAYRISGSGMHVLALFFKLRIEVNATTIKELKN
jgi:hypothetical protein